MGHVQQCQAGLVSGHLHSVYWKFVHAACSPVRLIQMLYPPFDRVPRKPLVGAAEKVRELGVASLMRAVSIFNHERGIP